jgi:carbon-monoxide dehydrogenase medium subunit
VFFRDAFWDGRANHTFNGLDPFGATANAGGAMASVDNGALASQADGPPGSGVEMACAGRTFNGANSLGTKLLAGGHSLIPLLRLRSYVRPSLLVDIGRLDDLRFVREEGDRIAIGALTRHAQLVADLPRTGVRARCRGAALVGDLRPPRHDRRLDRPRRPCIRPRDDRAQPRRRARRRRPRRRAHDPSRRVLHRCLFDGAGARDVLTEIRVPKTERGVYLKYQRSARDWATVGVAAADVGGRVQVALASMGATPLRAHAVERALVDGASPAEAAEHAAEGAEPQSDVSASSDYRAHLARVLARRALEQL